MRYLDITPLGQPFPWLLLMLTIFLSACGARPYADGSMHAFLDVKNAVFVTSNGWHSSIVIPRTDRLADRIPEVADFPKARFIEFGWGDAEYYPAKDTTIAMTLRAALLPTPAVMHVVGLDGDIAEIFAEYEVIGVSVNEQELTRLIDFLNASFERSGAPRATKSGPGLYATSYFYPATGRFHLDNSCNTWTARALRATGFDIRVSGTSKTEDLMHQVRKIKP